MNEGAVEGSAWRGKVLMSLSVAPMSLPDLPKTSAPARSGIHLYIFIYVICNMKGIGIACNTSIVYLPQ